MNEDLASPLRFDRRRKAFVFNGQKVKGLLNVLSDVFYPTYTIERAILGDDYSRPRERKDSEEKKKKPQVRWLRGAKRGSSVDAQLTVITKLTYDNRLPVLFWLAPRVQRPDDVSESAWAGILRRRRALHPYTKAFLRELHARKLVPVRAQFPVMARGVMIATAVDCLARHTETGELVVIDWKCGFEGYYEKYTGRYMNEPYQGRVDSPHNQHQLQLMMTLTLFAYTMHPNFEKTKECIRDTKAYIFRAHGEDQVSVYPLEDWARSSFATCVRVISDHLTRMSLLRVTQSSVPTARAKRVRVTTTVPAPKKSKKAKK